MARIHDLKTWPQYYQATVAGKKRFEFRKNDRDFQVGDVLVLQEFDPENGFTGEMESFRVTWILREFVPQDYVIMQIESYISEVEAGE